MVTRKIIISFAAAATLGMGIPAATNVAQAWDMGNFMDPSEWFGNDDDYYGRRGGYGYGPYGWAAPYYGAPYATPYAAPVAPPVASPAASVAVAPVAAPVASPPPMPTLLCRMSSRP